MRETVREQSRKDKDMELNLNLGDKTTGFDKSIQYDVLIIGAGPAGLSAALYAKRKGLTVGIVGAKAGGQVVDTTSVDNYIGIQDVTGEELSKRFSEHINQYGVPILRDETVKTFIKNGDVFTVSLSSADVIKTRALIIATGSKPRPLGVEGEEAFKGRGVAYCAICDGPLFEGMDVVVAGGGNSAVEAAMDLSKIARTVTIVHRSQLRADQILVDQMQKIDNIKVHLETQIEAIVGEQLVSGVEVLDKKSGERFKVEASGVFVEIGYLPNSDFVKGIVACNDRGEIKVNARNETSVPGVFAAGDVTDSPYKQIVISAGEGAKAALTANDYLR